MSKAVLISIRPQWCQKIASSEKTIEVRKTKPKLETPFKCYIYCTRDKHLAFMQNQTGTNLIACMDVDAAIPVGGAIGNGRIVGEFTCDRIYELAPLNHAPDDVEKQACLTREEIVNYLKGTGYGWHISDLRIYDTPKELSEFKTLCRVDADCCACPYYNYTKMDCDGRVIVGPPQSWCYVDDLQTK
jgi:predicted transcriptional regulator